MMIWRRRATLNRDEVDESLVAEKREASLGAGEKSEELRCGESGDIVEVLVGRDAGGEEKAVFSRCRLKVLLEKAGERPMFWKRDTVADMVVVVGWGRNGW
jgi:hypothetical protein